MYGFNRMKVFYLVLLVCALAGPAAAIWPTGSQNIVTCERYVTKRYDTKLPVQVVGDGWREAHKAGAPIYRNGDQPADWQTLAPLPASKRFVLAGNGVSFATDDLADVKRWYADLTYPALDNSQFPEVLYVYEVTGVQLVHVSSGSPRLIVTIHEARTGCALPSCDPVNGLPNYDRTYEVEASSIAIHIDGAGHA